jgi:hypothetical protein
MLEHGGREARLLQQTGHPGLQEPVGGLLPQCPLVEDLRHDRRPRPPLAGELVQHPLHARHFEQPAGQGPVQDVLQLARREDRSEVHDRPGRLGHGEALPATYVVVGEVGGTVEDNALQAAEAPSRGRDLDRVVLEDTPQASRGAM